MKIIKSIIKNLLPYGIIKILRLRHSMFGKPLESWEQAERNSTGYAADNILKATVDSMQKVINGEAAYARDSICFNKIEYSPLLLLALYMAAVMNSNKLNVLDFGGSLGTTYLQNKALLNMFDIKWNIIEQEHFVQAGKELYPDEECMFYNSIPACLQENKPNMILLSSVLPYIKNKDQILDELLTIDANYIVIDRTVVSDNKEDLVVVQNVPENIYKASYPAWIISKPRLLTQICQKYNLLFEGNSFTDSVANDMLYNEKCFVFKKR